MSLEQRDLSAQWGIGCSTHGTNGPRVTWATLTQAEREDVKSAWVVVDQKREIVHAREVETSRKNWDAGIAALPTREEINSAMVGMAQESIRFVRATVQDELSRAINPLSNEIGRLKREIADLTTAPKPQPTSAGSVVDTKETSSFERRLSRHAEHLSSIESRLKRIERGS